MGRVSLGILGMLLVTGHGVWATPVWNINVGQTTQASPMTFMVGGKQSVALPGTGVIVAYTIY